MLPLRVAAKHLDEPDDIGILRAELVVRPVTANYKVFWHVDLYTWRWRDIRRIAIIKKNDFGVSIVLMIK